MGAALWPGSHVTADAGVHSSLFRAESSDLWGWGTQAGDHPADARRSTPHPKGYWGRVYLLTVVVLALLQGFTEAFTQGQVTLSGRAVQELLDLVGAGPHL